ncbi:MAG: hypothetical protein R3A80_08090 [Bdellovibrionota bacterium]
MRQTWCTRLKLSSFIAFIAVLNTSHATESTLECSILEGNTQTPLQLKIKATPAAEGEENNDSDGSIEVKLTENNADLPLKLNGPYQSYYKNQLNLENIDYYPLGLLGLSESSIAHATYYYAKIDPSSIYFDLVVTSIMTENSEGELSYAGAYGSYKDRNVLCLK